jgi:hypothetical protein
MTPSPGTSKVLTISDAEAFIELARRLKVKKASFTYGLNFSKLRIELFEDKKEEPSLLAEIEAPSQKTRLPTEDELLYWSTAYEPDINASKPE